MTERYADYRYLGHCQQAVASSGCPEGFSDCGNPAVAKVWWDDEEKDSLLVCDGHLQEILISEWADSAAENANSIGPDGEMRD